ncbi:MAG: hypothetical protein KGP28_08595 [Bdellovibrionales bacterium]|nr:hypothetical protein [Bdellovibrionales bacterium]
MRIVMDFDGVYTDPTDEGEACSRRFRNKIISLQLVDVGLSTEEQVDCWLGELRARQSAYPFRFGWRSEGKVSAFTFEDPFIRNIGLADYLDHLAKGGDLRAKRVLSELKKTESIGSFGELSEWSFHQLRLKKAPDSAARKWVLEAIQRGHEVFIVSNSATEKIEEFLGQAGFPEDRRPQVRGGARKFGLGSKPSPLFLGTYAGESVEVDTDRPLYERALLEIQPDAVIGDVFCLDLSLPIRLKREKRLAFNGGIHYRHRDYTPTPMLDLVSGRSSTVPEVNVLRDWEQLAL